VQKQPFDGAGNRQQGKRQRTLPFSFARLLGQRLARHTAVLII